MASSDTGSSSTDNVTGDTTPTIALPGAPSGSKTKITAVNDETKVQCSFVKTSNSGSCILPQLAEGTWTVTATTTDAAGNTSPKSAPLEVKIASQTSLLSPDSTISNSIKDLTTISEENAKVGGIARDGWVRVDKSSTQYIITTSDGLKIAISANKVVDSTVKFNSRGMPVFYQGDEFRIEGEGLKPLSSATTWLFSEPTFLGGLTVKEDGSFAEEYPLGDGFPTGDHTAQLNAIAPDGTLRVVEVAVEIIADSADESSVPLVVDEQPTPQPPAGGAHNLQLIASALALLSIQRKRLKLKMSALTPPRTGRGLVADPIVLGQSKHDRDDELPTSEEESRAEIASLSASHGDGMSAVGDDILHMPRIRVVDDSLRRFSEAMARHSPMFARILNDGAYIRSLLGGFWLVLPIAGALLGWLCTTDTDSTVQIPALALISSVVVLGCIDSLAGLTFTVAYSLAQFLTGGLDSVPAIRGAMGIAVLSFAPTLIASSVRPFRRLSSDEHLAWNRVVDVVLTALFGAWAAGSMYSSIPTLSSITPPQSDRVDVIHGVVLATILCRWLLENLAPRVAPRRLEEISVQEFDEPSSLQRFLSDVTRTAVFAFIAASFIGINWALWVGSAMFFAPKVVDRQAEHFPNVSPLHRFVPRNLTRVVVMLFVAVWWGTLVESRYENSGDFILWAFVLMSIPGLMFNVCDWFGRESSGWRSTALSRVLGLFVLVIGVLVVRGVIL